MSDTATVAGFLYTTLLAIGLGMLCSTARWFLIDRLLRHQGISPASWDFRKLREMLPAFDRLIEDHFRYYQFHANGLIAVNSAIMLIWVGKGFEWAHLPILLVVDALLYFGAADTIRKYDERMTAILSRRSSLLNGEEFANIDV